MFMFVHCGLWLPILSLAVNINSPLTAQPIPLILARS